MIDYCNGYPPQVKAMQFKPNKRHEYRPEVTVGPHLKQHGRGRYVDIEVALQLFVVLLGFLVLCCVVLCCAVLCCGCVLCCIVIRLLITRRCTDRSLSTPTAALAKPSIGLSLTSSTFPLGISWVWMYV
jgi:hypothetical protein